jgi:hypothetical protein
MHEVVVINSFLNHDSKLYPIKNQKSIPRNSAKTTGIRHFNRKSNPLIPNILLYYYQKILVITDLYSLNIHYNLKCFLNGIKAHKKKCNLMIIGVDSFCVYLCNFLLYEGCVNAGEPAAVLRYLMQIKVVVEIQLVSTVAGSLLHPSPHYPIPPAPFLNKSSNNQKTMQNKSPFNCQLLIFNY